MDADTAGSTVRAVAGRWFFDRVLKPGRQFASRGLERLAAQPVARV